MTEDDLRLIPELFLTEKLQRVWPDAVVYKRTDGNYTDFGYTRDSLSSFMPLTDGTSKTIKRKGRTITLHPFVKASTAINLIVRSERARLAEEKHA